MIYSYALFSTSETLGKSDCLNDVECFHSSLSALYDLSTETVLYSTGPFFPCPVLCQIVAVMPPALNFISGFPSMCTISFLFGFCFNIPFFMGDKAPGMGCGMSITVSGVVYIGYCHMSSVQWKDLRMK